MNTENIKKKIEQELKIVDEKVAIYFSDLNGNTIEINSDEIYEAASCMKMFILLELFKQVYNKKINLNDKIIYNKKDYVEGSGIIRYLSDGLEMSVKDMAMLMIIVSDNIATNILIDYLGMENINETIKEVGLEKSKIYNKIYYPIDNICDITAKEYALVFEKIYKKELYNDEICEQMLNILINQQSRQMLLPSRMNQYLVSKYFKENINDKGLINYVANKCGKWEGVRNDGGLANI